MEKLKKIVKQIQDNQHNWFWFPAGTESGQTTSPRGFYQWACENKYPKGETHPLEEAHLAAYQLIKEKFNELVQESLE